MKEETYSFTKNGSVRAETGRSFFRSHRGFLVNLQEVVRYDNANIELKMAIECFWQNKNITILQLPI